MACRIGLQPGRTGQGLAAQLAGYPVQLHLAVNLLIADAAFKPDRGRDAAGQVGHEIRRIKALHPRIEHELHLRIPGYARLGFKLAGRQAGLHGIQIQTLQGSVAVQAQFGNFLGTLKAPIQSQNIGIQQARDFALTTGLYRYRIGLRRQYQIAPFQGQSQFRLTAGTSDRAIEFGPAIQQREGQRRQGHGGIGIGNLRRRKTQSQIALLEAPL